MNFSVFQSFRNRILLSFFAFIGILLIWISVFYYLNDKEKYLQNFSSRLAHIQNQFLESNRHLENFILFGFHQPQFYVTGKQEDIDVFLMDQKKILRYLWGIKGEAKTANINLESKLNLLTKLQTDLIDSVRSLKAIYFLKGFKDFGGEGKMRYYAHQIEDKGLLAEKDILQLRRHEKDFY